MRIDKRIIFLALIMACVASVVAGVAIGLLYTAALGEQAARLTETARTQARLIDAMAAANADRGQVDPDGRALSTTIEQIRRAHLPTLAETGELLVGMQKDDSIVFLLDLRHTPATGPDAIPIGSRLAEPMQRALHGDSGWLVGSDYRGERVLAAFEPSRELPVGVVAKIDLREVRAPFVRAGSIAAGCALLLILVGVVLFSRIGAAVAREIEDSRNRLLAMVNASPDKIYLLDEATTCLEVYTSDRGSLVAEPADLRGKRLCTFLPDEVVRPLTEAVSRTLQTGEVQRLEYELEVTAGRRWFEGRMAPVERPIGGQKTVLYVARDISLQKRAEAERQRAEEKLHHDQRLQSLAILAGGIAHDFNNLLMGVLGNADLALLDLPAEAPCARRIEEIQTTALRLAELNQKLVAYAGKGRFLVERLDLSRVVDDMTRKLQASVPENVTLKVDLARGLPAIEADAAQVQQAMVHLITNATEAIGETSGVVSVSSGVVEIDREHLRSAVLGEDLRAGRYAFVEVADTGTGMAPETLARAFDPFFSTKKIGRGLGLAAVHGIVRSHGGAIEIVSELGRGTNFRLLFPCLQS